MPVYANVTSLPDGGLWAALLIRIPAAKVNYSTAGVFENNLSANKWLHKNAMKYWRDKLNDYLNSREKALQEVNLLTPGLKNCLNQARFVNDKTATHENWCRHVLIAQDHITMLLPSTGSPHAYWRHYINELLGYCHSCIKSGAEKEVLKPQTI